MDWVGRYWIVKLEIILYDLVNFDVQFTSHVLLPKLTKSTNALRRLLLMNVANELNVVFYVHLLKSSLHCERLAAFKQLQNISTWTSQVYIYIFFLYYNLTLPLEPIEMKCLENCVTFFSFNPESKIHVEIINFKIIVSPPLSYVTNQLWA